MIYCIMLAIFFVTFLTGMDMPPAPLLIREIIDTRFAPCMTLQEMSRLQRTCKGYGGVIDIENLLRKHSYPLNHLFTHCSYDQRTFILAHYAVTKNKDMFTFLRDKEKGFRDDDVMYFNALGPTSLGYCMGLHAKEYSTRQKIQQVRIKQLSTVAWIGSNTRWGEFLKKILPKSGFNIWDIKIISSRKLLFFGGAKSKAQNYRKMIVRNICHCQDVDLLLAIMGDIIEPRALKYVFRYSKLSFIGALYKKDAFIEYAPDKHGKTFHDYKLEYSFVSYSNSNGRKQLIR